MRKTCFFLSLLLSLAILTACDGGETHPSPDDGENGEIVDNGDSTVIPSYGENIVDYDSLA